MPQIPASKAMEIVRDHPDKLFTIDINPQDFRFENQHPGEKVFVKIRASILVNIGWIFTTVFWSVLPFVAGIIYFWQPYRIEFDSLFSIELAVLIGLIYYSVILTNAFFKFLDWYYDIYLITNERVLHILFDPLKSYKVSEATLSDIEIVEEKTVGLLPSLFNYGDVRVTTAATKGSFKFLMIPEPSWFRKIIIHLSKEARREYGNR